jgi:hypothetical protein
MKNPATFVDELPPDQLLADDQGSDDDDHGLQGLGQLADEDFDVDIDINEEDLENVPYVGGEFFAIFCVWKILKKYFIFLV